MIKGTEAKLSADSCRPLKGLYLENSGTQFVRRPALGAQWRATLPVGGEPSTLGRRFRGTLLEGKLFAKTGMLNQSNVLSGYMIAKSGKTLIFSSFANDVPEDVHANLIAAEN